MLLYGLLYAFHCMFFTHAYVCSSLYAYVCFSLYAYVCFSLYAYVCFSLYAYVCFSCTACCSLSSLSSQSSQSLSSSQLSLKSPSHVLAPGISAMMWSTAAVFYIVTLPHVCVHAICYSCHRTQRRRHGKTHSVVNYQHQQTSLCSGTHNTMCGIVKAVDA